MMGTEDLGTATSSYCSFFHATGSFPGWRIRWASQSTAPTHQARPDHSYSPDPWSLDDHLLGFPNFPRVICRGSAERRSYYVMQIPQAVNDVRRFKVESP